MGAAGNKKPKGMHKNMLRLIIEEAIHENDLKKEKEINRFDGLF